MNSYELLMDLRERLTNGAMYVEDGTLEALDMAMNALSGPEWVRTADRLPTVNDARYDGTVLIANKSHRYGLRYWSYLEDEIEICPYWMPLPKLPEVEG